MDCRQSRITIDQKDKLLDMMRTRYHSLFGKESRLPHINQRETIWKEISNELNAIGAEKTVKKWLGTFTEMRSRVICFTL